MAQLATEPGSAKNLVAVVKTAAHLEKLRQDQVAAVESATCAPWAARSGSPSSSHLLTHNALSLALYGSEDEAVRVMDPNTVFALLLDRPAMTCIEDGRLTLWVDALDAAVDQRRQQALIEVFNQLALRCSGCVVPISLRQNRGGKTC